MGFVIYDEDNDGYAVDDPIEGWIFTVLRSHEKVFNSRQEAANVIRTHYKGHRDLVVLKQK